MFLALPACSLNLKQCKRVGDAGLAAVAPKLQHLTSLCLQARSAALLLLPVMLLLLRAANIACWSPRASGPRAVRWRRAGRAVEPSQLPSLRPGADPKAAMLSMKPPHSHPTPPHAFTLLQGMGEVTDAGVAHLASLRSLEELELQFAW